MRPYEREDNRSEDKSSGRRTAVLLITLFLLIASFSAVVLTIINHGDDHFEYNVSDTPTGDASLSEETKKRWEQYLGSSGYIEPGLPDIRTEWSDLETVVNIEEINESAEGIEAPGAGGEGINESDYSQDGSLNDDRSESEDSGSKNREVEESDIVKTKGDRIYVLNPTMGFIIINGEDPRAPYIEGRLRIFGSPVSMYVVDFLAFIVVSEGVGVYDYYGGITPDTGGHLYIVSILDNENPRIVKKVPLGGNPLDSRRVGEVIYLVSNNYPYYGYRYEESEVYDEGDDSADETPSSGVKETSESVEDLEDDYWTEVVSIAFNDPENIGEVDRAKFSGTSSHIYASQTAVFIAQSNGWIWGGSGPSTDVTYVDISDPMGDIEVRDDIEVDGYMGDRYQMDYYGGSFRIVTQDMGRELMESTLYTIDCSDPDDLSVMGSLLIDDAGSLMATRFSGERAYTIHLPRAVDPLDVIDLSDPYNPTLEAVLELPGWVEHMEVIGYDIIALGVDDSEGNWKVALSLFDVEDAQEPILQERITIGEGYTYSEANWDPKALSVLEEVGMVLIPYTSYDWERMGGMDTGIQIVSFDLEEGTLEKRGVIPSSSPPRRSRILNDAVMAVSNRELLSVDVSDPDEPVIQGIVPLAVNVREAFMVGDTPITVTVPDWGESGARIRVHDDRDVDSILGSYGPENLQFEGVERIGNYVYIKGIRQGEGYEAPIWELHRYNLMNPENPIISDPLTIEIPEIHWYDSHKEVLKGSDDDPDSEWITSDEISPTSVPMVMWDPIRWIPSGESVVIVDTTPYSVYGKGDNEKILMIEWTGEGVSKTDLDKRSGYLTDAYSYEDRTVIAYYDYSYGSTITTVQVLDRLSDGTNQEFTNDLTGNIAGMSVDLSTAYTQYRYWEGIDEYYYQGKQYNSLLTYNLSETGAEMVNAIELGPEMTVTHVTDDALVLTTGYYYYYPVYEYDEVAVAGESVGIRGEEGSYTPETVIQVVMLEDGIPSNIRKLTLEGSFRFSYGTEEKIILQDGSLIMEVDLSDMEDPSIKGPWKVPGYVNGGDDRIVAMGLWGSQLIGD